MKKILIMGLPGTGKTTFARELMEQMNSEGKMAAWFNADDVRKMYNDWDFSTEGRIRQAERMKKLTDESGFDYVICDFVAPTKEVRNIFGADYIVWMDTEESSLYDDTNAIFEKPEFGEWSYIVKAKDAKNTVSPFLQQIL